MNASPEIVANLSIFRPDDGLLEIVSVQGDDGDSRRLCELGLCVGKTVSLIKAGDPAIIRLGESRFAVAARLLLRVFARPKAAV